MNYNLYCGKYTGIAEEWKNDESRKDWEVKCVKKVQWFLGIVVFSGADSGAVDQQLSICGVWRFWILRKRI
mgnify:CR=1 FL=1